MSSLVAKRSSTKISLDSPFIGCSPLASAWISKIPWSDRGMFGAQTDSCILRFHLFCAISSTLTFSLLALVIFKVPRHSQTDLLKVGVFAIDNNFASVGIDQTCHPLRVLFCQRRNRQAHPLTK